MARTVTRTASSCTVPLILMKLVFDMSAEEKQVQLAMLGAISAAMIAAGYPGEMITQSSSPFGTRCMG